ncbi:MAG TPA: hypothetical protein VFS18_00980 [Actinomycetota bacterium]|nr:hypothetical protein [Actinomycetota bacterium]
MSREGPPPSFAERARMPLRIGAVFVAYALYRVAAGTSAAGALFLGGGFVLVAWVTIDRYTMWRRDRSGLLQVGSFILGLGLLGLGLYLVLR